MPLLLGRSEPITLASAQLDIFSTVNKMYQFGSMRVIDEQLWFVHFAFISVEGQNDKRTIFGIIQQAQIAAPAWRVIARAVAEAQSIPLTVRYIYSNSSRLSNSFCI